MYKVQLIKGLSYTGVVRATKDSPIVEVDDEKTADDLVKTGYFKLVETAAGNTDGDDKGADISKMTVPELKKYAADKGIDLAGADKKADIVAKIKEAETAAGNTDGDDGSADFGEDE